LKKLFGIAAALALSLFLGGCVTPAPPYVWDASLPETQTATVHFIDFYPTSMNGINLDMGNSIAIKIPAGDAQFLLNSRPYATGHYNIIDAIFKYRFEAGKDYTIRYNVQEVGGGRLILGVGVFRGIPSESGYGASPLDVVPFPNIK
jgi:hypothetical protein